MAEKGFAKAKDVERVSKEEMEALANTDATASVKGAKTARKAYEDEFTEEPSADVDIPEELEEPEVPEAKTIPEKKPKKTEVRTGEETAKAIFDEGYRAGYAEGHKRARAEFLERLVG